jgi:transcriptional accessory protein Tex/SPT6
MPFNPHKYLKENKMTMKKAEGLFALAHRNLTPKQVDDTHKAEHYLEKKGVEAKRVEGGFKFDGKKVGLHEHVPLNDMEGEMAIAELNGVIEYANEILGMLKPETQLEAWVQSKITKAKDDLDSVADYLKRTPGAME